MLASKAVVGLETPLSLVREVNQPKRHRVHQGITLNIGECSGEKLFSILDTLMTSYKPLALAGGS
jgi:hypothetical protein